MSVRDLIPWGRDDGNRPPTIFGDGDPFLSLHREVNRLARRIAQGLDVVARRRAQVRSLPAFRGKMDQTVPELIGALVPRLRDEPLGNQGHDDAIDRAPRVGEELRQLDDVELARVVGDRLQNNHELGEGRRALHLLHTGLRAAARLVVFGHQGSFDPSLTSSGGRVDNVGKLTTMWTTGQFHPLSIHQYTYASKGR